MNSAPSGDKARAALLLRRSSLFRSLPPAAIARLAAGSSALTRARGEQLFGCGERCAGLYTVTSGRIALSVSVAAGPSKVIDLVGPGGHIGLAAVVLDANHTAAAQALADSALMLTPRETLLECGADVTELWPRLAAALGRQVGGLIADVAAFSLNSGRERVAHYLLEIANSRGNRQHPVTLPAKKSIIASRLNLTPEYFSRMLHELIADGTIAVNGRHITVLDPVRLREVRH
jgi:CRP-like cAMP-binding protein